jgi:arylsulfatase A-like enzyme
MCTLLSKHVGRIFRLIEDTGLDRRTVVSFMSDHGMYLGEHGRTGKSSITHDTWDCFPFHRELTRICWTTYIPDFLKTTPLEPGTRFKHLVQAPDLMPTLLDLCGLDVPSAVEGKSLAPLLRGEGGDEPRDLAITTWTLATHHRKGLVYCRKPAVTNGRWTLLINEPPDPAAPELYDNDADPAQHHDVIAEHPDQARRLHAGLIDFLKTHDAPPEAIERLSAENVGLGSGS